MLFFGFFCSVVGGRGGKGFFFLECWVIMLVVGFGSFCFVLLFFVFLLFFLLDLFEFGEVLLILLGFVCEVLIIVELFNLVLFFLVGVFLVVIIEEIELGIVCFVVVVEGLYKLVVVIIGILGCGFVFVWMFLNLLVGIFNSL